MGAGLPLHLRVASTLSEQIVQEINSFRREKDAFFASDHQSPIPHEARASFKGLNYFQPDPNYRVRARLTRFSKPEHVIMTTSKGTQQRYLKYGTFNFELQGEKLQLLAYKSADRPHERSLFVPFTDETSGKDTYGSGRYLDVEETGRDDYDLDFNFAYNPYCAYSQDYICPFPGRENRLPTRILAGEKTYK